MALNQTFNQDSAGNIGNSGAVSTSSPTYTSGVYAALSLTVAGALRTDSSATTQPISASSLPLPTGAATAALQTAGNSTLTSISSQLPAALGQTTMANSLPVVIASNQTAIPVSGTITPSNAYAQGATTAGELGFLMQGAATTASPSYTTATTNPLSLTLAGALRVDGSAVTQPVSAASLPLPTGAATSALQTSGNTTLTAISAQLPASLGAKTTANSLAVNIASDQVVPVSIAASTSSSAALTSVAGSATSTSLLASNANRKSMIIFNDSLSVLYIAFAASASATAFTQKLQPGSSYASDLNYTGAVSGIWVTATGNARITELT